MGVGGSRRIKSSIRKSFCNLLLEVFKLFLLLDILNRPFVQVELQVPSLITLCAGITIILKSPGTLSHQTEGLLWRILSIQTLALTHIGQVPREEVTMIVVGAQRRKDQ